jgi:hypothetical protein
MFIVGTPKEVNAHQSAEDDCGGGTGIRTASFSDPGGHIWEIAHSLS